MLGDPDGRCTYDNDVWALAPSHGTTGLPALDGRALLLPIPIRLPIPLPIAVRLVRRAVGVALDEFDVLRPGCDRTCRCSCGTIANGKLARGAAGGGGRTENAMLNLADNMDPKVWWCGVHSDVYAARQRKLDGAKKLVGRESVVGTAGHNFELLSQAVFSEFFAGYAG